MSTAGLWGATLVVGLVVVVVVALLLAWIVSTARKIEAALIQIWIVGPKIANNTAHLDILRRINRVAGEILAGAGRVASGAERIHAHANGCPGCPHCVIGWGR